MSQKLLDAQQQLALALEVQTAKREALEKDPTNEELIDGLEEANNDVAAREETVHLIKRSEEALMRAVTQPKRILHPEPEPDGLPGHAVTTDVRDAGLSNPTRGFNTYADFLGAVKAADSSRGANVDTRLRILGATGMSEGIGADGGWLAPPTYETEIWDSVMAEDALNLVSRCDQRMISGRSLTLNADAETSKADGSRHGGVRGYWIPEGGTLTASRPKYRQLTLKPKKLTVLAYLTGELEDDAPAAAAHLQKVVPSEMAYMINRAIVRGTGTGEPLGILNSGGLTTVAVETGQTSADPLLAENIDKMYSRMIGSSLPGAVWLINQGLTPYLQAMGRTVGAAGWPAYMPPGGLSQSPYGSLKGLPVLPCPWCSAYNTTGDIILANLKGYLVGTKGGVRADTSIHVQWLTDEKSYRFIFRIDGQPWRASPLTPENVSGTETLSDFVALATRS